MRRRDPEGRAPLARVGHAHEARRHHVGDLPGAPLPPAAGQGARCIEHVRVEPVGGQHVGDLRGQPDPGGRVPGAARGHPLRHAADQPRDGARADRDRRYVGLQEVAVVHVRLFLPGGHGDAPPLVPVARLLLYGYAAAEEAALPRDLKAQSLFQVVERPDVLYLYLWAAADRDVPVGPHGPLEGRVGRAQVLDRVGQHAEEPPGLPRAVHVRLGHDLDEGGAGPVVVDERRARSSRALAVHDAAGVLLELDAAHADDGALPYVDAPPAPADAARPVRVELRYLVVLWQVGVKVVLAEERDAPGGRAAERGGHHDGPLDGAAVEARQRAGQAHAHGAHVRVGLLSAVRRRARAEELCPQARQLAVHLEPDPSGGIFRRGGRAPPLAAQSAGASTGPAAASSARATRSASASRIAPPITCTPTGIPPPGPALPNGTDVAGLPVRLARTVA